jgi:hypothetical protein
MAKKLNKLLARIEALEKAVAGFLTGRKAPRKKAAKASRRKAVKKTAKKTVAKSKRAVRKTKRKTASRPKTKAAKAPVAARRAIAKKRVPPTIAQLAPSGMPDLVTPLDKV